MYGNKFADDFVAVAYYSGNSQWAALYSAMTTLPPTQVRGVCVFVDVELCVGECIVRDVHIHYINN
jgi:hypothetical protein